MTQRGVRRILLLRVPWVEWTDERRQCIGPVTGAPLRESYEEHGRPPVPVDPYRCKNPAHWEFAPLPDSEVASGSYCQTHLVNRALLADGPERNRFEEWLAKDSRATE